MASQVDLYCQIGRERLLIQDSQNREFATKAINYLAFGSGMIGMARLSCGCLSLNPRCWRSGRSLSLPCCLRQ